MNFNNSNTFEQEIEQSRADNFENDWKENMRLKRSFFPELSEEEIEFNRKIKSTNRIRGLAEDFDGFFVEEFFLTAFIKYGKKTFFGEKFDEIENHVKGFTKDGFEDEYDIILINEKTIAIIETIYNAREKHVPKVLKKAETFRVNFPEYENHKVFLGLASMAFYPELEEDCKTNGVAIVKQIGDSVVIYDEHLKAF